VLSLLFGDQLRGVRAGLLPLFRGLPALSLRLFGLLLGLGLPGLCGRLLPLFDQLSQLLLSVLRLHLLQWHGLPLLRLRPGVLPLLGRLPGVFLSHLELRSLPQRLSLRALRRRFRASFGQHALPAVRLGIGQLPAVRILDRLRPLHGGVLPQRWELLAVQQWLWELRGDCLLHQVPPGVLAQRGGLP
jgi:hypothetical protein